MSDQISSEDSITALKNDYMELLSTFNPAYVSIRREPAPAGSMCLLRIDAKMPTYYLTSYEDKTPKPTDALTFYIDVVPGYPQSQPEVYFAKGKRLAGQNTFQSGAQCTDTWTPYSSLRTLAEKTVRAILHDPAVGRADSPASAFLVPWQKKLTDEGQFPSLKDLRVLYADAVVPLPEGRQPASSPPPLPGGGRPASSVPPLPGGRPQRGGTPR